MVVPFYWLMLAKYDFTAEKPLMRKVGTIFDHSFGLICLLIDYTFNNIPVVSRHVWLLIVVMMSYLMVNFSVTKYRGKGVYGHMTDWESPVGIILPLLMFGIALAVFCAFKRFNDWKLRYNNISSL